MHKVNFGGIREEIIQRDGECCVQCGMTRAEHRSEFGRDITVDHIDGRGCNSEVADKNNDPKNLQTLCLPCHSRKDALRNQVRDTSRDDEILEIYLGGQSIRVVQEVLGLGFNTVRRCLLAHGVTRCRS
jgi:5-methylcytosine-specific restriction endonuclease McrA